MGAFFVNYQIKGVEQSQAVAAAGAVVQARAYISPAKNEWVTLYDEISESQDAYEIGRLGGELSTRLQTVVFVFLVADSTMFVYYIFDNGDLLDEYNSEPPPTSVAADADQKTRFIGRPDIVMNYCAPGTHRGDVEAALLRGESLVEGGFASSVNAEERLHALAKILQMDDLRASMGFVGFDRQQAKVLEGRDFLKIDGKKLRRPVARHIPPTVPRSPGK